MRPRRVDIREIRLIWMLISISGIVELTSSQLVVWDILTLHRIYSRFQISLDGVIHGIKCVVVAVDVRVFNRYGQLMGRHSPVCGHPCRAHIFCWSLIIVPHTLFSRVAVPAPYDGFWTTRTACLLLFTFHAVADSRTSVLLLSLACAGSPVASVAILSSGARFSRSFTSCA